MHQDLPRIDRGEEVPAQHRHEQERCQHDGHKACHEAAALTERQRPIGEPKPSAWRSLP